MFAFIPSATEPKSDMSEDASLEGIAKKVRRLEILAYVTIVLLVILVLVG